MAQVMTMYRSCSGYKDRWNCCTQEDANGKWKRR